MKAKIHIHGQVASSYTIYRELSAYNEKKESFPGQISLYYNTTKEAREDLKKAFKRLKESEPEGLREGWITYWRGAVTYDTATAVVIKL